MIQSQIDQNYGGIKISTKLNINSEIIGEITTAEFQNAIFCIICIEIVVKQAVDVIEAKQLPTEFLSVREASKLLNLCTKTAYNIIYTGRIKAVRLSDRKILIKRTEVDKVFEQSEVPVKIREKPKRKPHPRYCYTMAEAQEKFNFSEIVLYSLIKRNNIQKYQSGWYIYVLKSDLERIINLSRESYG